MKYLSGMISLFLLMAFGTSGIQAQTVPWPEMHAFHDVMSPSFHGAEEGNLQPLREKAGMLLDKAVAWQKSPVPAGYKAEQTKSTLKRLVKQCKVIKKNVKAGKSDAELTAQITKGHDIFHEIMEKCRD